MSTDRQQGFKMLFLAACIIAANFITTRPAPTQQTAQIHIAFHKAALHKGTQQ